MTIPVILPFTDPETTAGYYQNVSHQLVMNAVGLFGNVGIECISTFLISNVVVAVETICFELGEFSDILKTDDKAAVPTNNNKLRLRNLLVQMQDVDR